MLADDVLFEPLADPVCLEVGEELKVELLLTYKCTVLFDLLADPVCLEIGQELEV